MKNKTAALSDISRTNQLKILENPQEVAEKLRKYLFKEGQGIEHFELKYPIVEDKDSENEDSRPTFYKERHKYIKAQVQERLAAHGEKREKSEIQYFFSYNGGKKYVFFLSPNKNHSGWQKLFTDNSSDLEIIFNLIFKFYILSQGLYFETLNGFEELLLLHSRDLSKSKEALLVWGQNLLVKYNQHGVLTLTLSRKHRLFLPKDSYSTIDGDDLGDLLVYDNKNYYFDRDLDARKTNKINFMQFDSDPKNYDKFKKTQLYHYQNLMTKLEGFLSECNIAFESLDFQADHYLENPFIKNIESVEFLEIINNTGLDLTEDDRQFLQCFLKHQGVSTIAFYNHGKTVSTYEQVPDGEDEVCWRITESIKWSDIQLEAGKNYLVFNKLLEEESGSMAYQAKDNLWYPSTTIDNQSQVDFYSQLKKRFNYLETGQFFSTQGINIPEFRAVGDEKTDFAVFNYTNWKIDRDLDSLHKETQAFTEGKLLDVEDSIFCYLKAQEDSKEWEIFCDKYKIKISPEFQKVLIELGIKNWISQSLSNPNLGLPITTPQSFSEKQFFSIYVRSPKNKEAKAVAVEFIYKDGCIYIKNVMHDLKQIESKFRFLRRQRNNAKKLINDQKYFVDESEGLYISCYTNDFYTPTLIGRTGIIEDLESGELTIDRKNQSENSSRFLPLVSHYNSEIKPINRIQNMICLDLKNETFIQYYVPPRQNIAGSIKKGFRAYHLMGKRYGGESMTTSELSEHPITALHFSTLTQNVLKMGDNSQSSLLQKVAQVLIEN
ncbi:MULTISPECIES: hypothetical protein [unclassified Microcoleus]|uniref:hypothetical protein n=1 Tax=unclassified Microcoleus TaxID=2642155 RepID=UPI0025E4F98E|nr:MULTISPECIES: hypothetical protein [unclassified Microcoleus]